MSDIRIIKEKAFLLTVFILTALGIIPVFYVLTTVIYKGIEAFSAHGLKIIVEVKGGILSSIIGSFILSITSSIIGVTLALFAGLFIAEFPNSIISKVTRVVSKSLLEVPTVLLGMLVYIMLVVPTGNFSLLAGALALALVMLPYVMVHVEQAVESVPSIYREAGYSIGMTRAQVLIGVVLGIARRGLASGILMGFAKAMGETAPLLFTIGAARSSLPTSIWGPGDAIPLMVFQYAQMPSRYYHDLAWAGSFILVVAFLIVFIAIRYLSKGVEY